MNYPKESINPKWRELSKKCRSFVAELSETNPFLASLILELLDTIKHYIYEFTNYEAIAFVRLLQKTGYDRIMTGPDTLCSNPELFWDLVDAALAEPVPAGESCNRALGGVLAFYTFIHHKKLFTREFIDHPRSVAALVHRGYFWKFLKTRYKSRDKVFIVKRYGQKDTVIFGYLEYRSAYLESLVRKAFTSRKNLCDNKRDRTRDVMENFESVFEHPEQLEDYTDMTPAVFDYAIKNIRSTYPGESRLEIRQDWLKTLFCIWSDVLMSHPDYDFFKGTYFYNTDFVLNEFTPLYIARGYEVVPAGRCGELPPYFKILFIIKREDLRSASGKLTCMRSVDFSDVPHYGWRKILVNFADKCACLGNKKYNNVFDFMEWVMECKVGTVRTYEFSARDLELYRSRLFFKPWLLSSKNAILHAVKFFLRWADKMNYIKLQPHALRKFVGFNYRYQPDPRSLSMSELSAIYDALRKLAEVRNDPRYLLSLAVSKIQMLGESRAGYICKLDLQKIRFAEDGSCTVFALDKNGGDACKEKYFSPEATDVIREAMDVSRDCRQRCPVGGPKTNVFLYEVKDGAMPFCVMDVSRYNKDLGDACALAGIQYSNSGNIRDTYETAVKKLVREKKLTSLEEMELTGHVKKTSTNCYDDMDLRDILKAARDLNIGNLIIKK